MSDDLTIWFRQTIKKYLNVNAISDKTFPYLKDYLNQENFCVKKTSFQNHLADAICNGSLTIEDYESLTEEDFDAQQELTEWLCEVWQELFDDPLPESKQDDELDDGW